MPLMTRLQPPWSGQTSWHVARWGMAGWVETAIKLVAIFFAITAALDDGAWAVPASHRLAFWTLSAVTIAYVVAVADRWIDRELVALAFVLAMIAGHASLVYAMGRAEWPARPVRVFAGLMLLGDLVKLATFVHTGTRVRDLPRAVPIAMTAVLAALYGMVALAA